MKTIPFVRLFLKLREAVVLSFVAVLIAGGAGTVRGQSALDGFDPNANGTVRVVVVQPDGKILLGGDFTSLSPNGGPAVARSYLARLNPDGTLDEDFDPAANNFVYSIAIQPDGKILVGGDFTSMGGQPRNRIARLHQTFGVSDSFDPNANSTVFSVAVQTDGKVLAGGIFTSIGGQTRNKIARLSATTGAADLSFNPNANDHVRCIAVQTDGKILVGGFFSSIGGQTRNRIARLDPTNGQADSFNPNANGNVITIVVQPDGKILVGGLFTNIGGQPRTGIARLEATLGQADSFNPVALDNVYAIAVQADGKILVGGAFFRVGGENRRNLARLDATTGAADSFSPNPEAAAVIHAIAVQMDGKILVGGDFNNLAPEGGGGVTRNRIARLEIDGRLDQTINLNFTENAFVQCVAVQPDGKILIGGAFTTVLGTPRAGLARLNKNGTLDTAFYPNMFGGFVSAVAVQVDGKILVGGNFTGIGGQNRSNIARLDAANGQADSFDPKANDAVGTLAVQTDGKILIGGAFTTLSPNGGATVTRNHIARLNPAGTLDAAFDPNASNTVRAIAIQADGKIVVGGEFTSNIGGQPRNRIARLEMATGAADSFNPSADSSVRSIALQLDGKILVGGVFNTIGGQTRNHMARLDAGTGAADLFDPNADTSVESIAIQADGKVLASGNFTTIGGQARNRMARLDAGTGAADSFAPNADSFLPGITLEPDGKLLAGGAFNTIGGQPRKLFARLSNDTAALQELSVTQNNITWARGGSSPQFRRVTFEVSFDNVDYSPLGSGTVAGRNWVRTGSGLPTGQSLYIRARGYYSGGLQNGSESITESVRNVILTSTPALCAREKIIDGGFEGGVPNPSWGETSTNFGSPLCSEALCGSEAPRSGTFLAWFGGVAAPEISTLEQTVTIPSGGPATLRFWMRIGSVSATFTDVLTVKVDGALVAIYGEPSLPESFYTERTIDLSAFANDGSHSIQFEYSGSTGGVSNFFVDDVSLLAGPCPGLVGNVSTRLPVGTGDNALIEGFIVQGPVGSTKKIMVRAIGPSLIPFGVADALGNPTLEIRDANSGLIASNDNWQTTQVGGIITSDQSTEISGSGLAPGNGQESAIIANLAPGNYTAVVRGAGNTVGTGVVDAYDMSAASPARLANIATRGLIQPGDKLMIAGFIIQNGNVRAVVRAIGPSLSAFGITNALPDTTLQLTNQNGVTVRANDDWQSDQKQELEGTGLQPSDSLEAAIVATIAPGQYTVQVRGKPETTGIGVVQVYFLQ